MSKPHFRFPFFLFYSLFSLSSYAQNPLLVNTNLDPKNALIYKNCGNNSLADSTSSPQQILSTLFRELLNQSLISKYYQTSVGDEKTSISGIFQCRNDLSQNKCASCIKKIPEFSKTQCGTRIPSRIHLSGCYIHYKPEGHVYSRLEVQHTKCGEPRGENNWEGFGEIRERAFEEVGDCIVEGEGYCDMRYESMHVVAQCGGDLGKCECGECVSHAMGTLRDECVHSISGEVYLDGCFVSYSWYYESGNSGYSNEDYGPERNGSVKLVAIVVGGVAILALGVMFLYLFRRNKDDEL